MHLLTGGTGYVGGRLLRRLERDGVSVRCLCRNPEALRPRVDPGIEVVQGDLLQPASLGAAFRGVDTAFYLVHSMNSGPEFEAREHEAAANFAVAAREAGVRRIVYLGGLAYGKELSPHMHSRAETGNILRSSGIPVIEFQASIVIGSGSASFEMIRSLVDRLPAMITPRWVNTAAQPIAIEDVVEYLAAASRIPLKENLTVEIGGSDVTSYLGIMREYARQRKLRRWIVRVPFLSLSLSSRWLTLITPVYASIGRCLIESVRHPSVVRNASAAELFAVRPMGITRAIERALATENGPCVESRWCDAGGPAGSGGGAREPSRDLLINEQTIRVPVTPDRAFAPIRRIGGRNGWYFGNVLWRVRGLIDLMMGGVGMRRGRPDPETPRPGSTLDFWRVEGYEPGRRLRLFAEMRLPGRAWLEFRAEADGSATVLRQIAQFEPRGLSGLLYWYLLWPVHEVVFRGMLRRIAAAALATERTGEAAVNNAAYAAGSVREMVVGDPLPRLRGEFLTGRGAELPQAASGKVALLLLGFSYDSRFAVEAWAGRFREQFEGDLRVTFYEIPMIGGLARLGKWFIDGGMRRGTPKADQENVITVYGGTEPWKQRVAFRDANAAYLILIDQRGNVVWRYAGGFGEGPYRALASEVSKLLR